MPSTTTSGARYLLVAVDASTIAPDARHSSTLALAAALAAPADEIHLLSVLSGGSASSSSPLALLPSPGLSTAGAAEALVEARIRASKEDRIAASSWLHSSRAALVGEFGVEQERVFLHLLNPAAPGSSSSSSSSPSSSSTAAAIVAYAHAKHADVVVLGSRGMGALARAVGGLDCQHLQRHALPAIEPAQGERRLAQHAQSEVFRWRQDVGQHDRGLRME